MLIPTLLSLVVCISAAVLEPVASMQRRQIPIASVPSPPSQCAASCGPANSEISLGCPFTGCCTTTFETNYFNCLDCVGTALNATSYANAQNNLNLLYTTCVDMGFVLPQLFLPNQTASGASAHPASTATALFPTGSTSAGSSGSGSHTTSAAVTGAGVHTVALSGATVLLWLAGIW